MDGEELYLRHGSAVIAAITSCTNTSNPSVMMGAGLLARKAVEKGLSVAPHVKTSLAPGSKVVTEYLQTSGLIDPLEQLRFDVVGYGCTTCIGNSGPLAEEISAAVEENDLVVAAVLSGNRNFEGRINPDVRANYLASPPLVVAYALAGTVDIDLSRDPIGEDEDGNPVYLQDIWPSQEEVAREIENALDPEIYKEQYADVYTGNEQWNDVEVPSGDLYEWDPDSTYIQEPSFFKDMGPEPEDLKDIEGARVLVKVGDSVTTDHISPAGAIPSRMPAGQYLIQKGVDSRDFNSYGSRRGNHEVMVRGTFGNIRLRNQLVDKEGGYTLHLPGRRRDHDLRSEPEVRGGERAAHRPRRQRVRLRLLARLGGERLVPARCQGRYRGELRAHPPFEPDRHGCPPATVRRGRERRIPGAEWPRVLRHHRPRRSRTGHRAVRKGHL